MHDGHKPFSEALTRLFVAGNLNERFGRIMGLVDFDAGLPVLLGVMSMTEKYVLTVDFVQTLVRGSRVDGHWSFYTASFNFPSQYIFSCLLLLSRTHLGSIDKGN